MSLSRRTYAKQSNLAPEPILRADGSASLPYLANDQQQRPERHGVENVYLRKAEETLLLLPATGAGIASLVPQVGDLYTSCSMTRMIPD